MGTLQIAIVGAGIGGLTAAHALSRQGIDVTVYEQAPELGEVGAGIGLSRNSVRLLERLDLGARIRQASVAVSEMRLHHSDGELVSAQSIAGEIHAIYRPDLVAILADNLPTSTITTGRRCVGFSQDQDHATIVFDDGEHAAADAVVAADGIHSSLQGYVVPPNDPIFSGSIAYRGVLPADRLPGYPSDQGALWMGEGRHFIAYPPFHGGLINYVGFVPTDEEMRESWSAPGDPEALAAEFAGWDPQLQRIISQIDTTFRWGLYDRDPLPRWTDGRLTLLGDAAHPMLPHVGQGANQAIEDAVALATLLGDVDSADAPQALLRYESLRRPRTAQMQATGRINGQVLDSADISERNHQLDQIFVSMQTVSDYDVEAEAEAVR
jgi:salicylate hydroxylase